MTTKIHHNTLKSAASHGMRIVEIAKGKGAAVFEVRTLNCDILVDAAGEPKAALKAAIEMIEERAYENECEFDEALESFEEDNAQEGDEGDEGETKSIIKHKYRVAYKPHKYTCGDEITVMVREKFMTVDTGENNRKNMNMKAFIRFAKANDCWSDSYSALNNGMQRMNVVNRLRAKVKKGIEIVW